MLNAPSLPTMECVAETHKVFNTTPTGPLIDLTPQMREELMTNNDVDDGWLCFSLCSVSNLTSHF